MMRDHEALRAVFLDRDGTLIEDRGYICEINDVSIYPFAVEALRRLHQAGFLNVVVTNQSAVARGFCREERIREINLYIQNCFADQGAPIHAFYYSPFHEDAVLEAYRRRDPKRKPEPGMLLQAASDFGIKLDESFMIGDSPRDIIAGKRAGCVTGLVLTGKGTQALGELQRLKRKPDFVADHLLAAASRILESGLRD